MAPPAIVVFDLTPYQERVKLAELHLRTLIASGFASYNELVAAKLMWLLTKADVKGGPSTITLRALRSQRDIQQSEILMVPGLIGPDMWMKGILSQIKNDAFYETIEPGPYSMRMQEYESLSVTFQADPKKIRDNLPKEWQGPPLWFYQSNPQLKVAAKYFADEFLKWSRMQPISRDFLSMKPSPEGVGKFVSQKPMGLILLRLTQTVTKSGQDPMESITALARQQSSRLFPSDLKYPPDVRQIDLDNPAHLQEYLTSAKANNIEISDDFAKAIGDLTNDLAVPKAPRVIPGLPPGEETWGEIITSTVFSFIPGLSQVIDIAAVYNGYNMFHRPLSNFERAIILLFLLFPFIRKFGKIGWRLGKPVLQPVVHFLSETSAVWKGELDTAVRIASEKIMQQAYATVGPMLLSVSHEAEQTITRGATILMKSATEKIPPKLRAEIAETISNVFIHAGTVVESEVEKIIVKYRTKLLIKFPILNFLEEESLRRVVYRFNKDHMKGQILEEFAGSFIRDMISHRLVGQLFHIEPLLKEGWQLHHIQGHQITDLGGRALTDGLVILRKPQVLNAAGELEPEVVKIVAVFECKAGKAASRELTYGGITSFEKLPEYWKKSIYAEADKVLDAERAAAAALGKSYEKSVDDVARQIFKEEKGLGQIQRDYVRMTESNAIKIDGKIVNIEITKEETEWWGLVPRGLGQEMQSNMESQLRVLGFSKTFVEPLNIGHDVLTEAADILFELAMLIFSKR